MKGAPTIAILLARLFFAFAFAQGAAFKFVFIGMDATAAEIAGARASPSRSCSPGSRPFSKRGWRSRS